MYSVAVFPRDAVRSFPIRAVYCTRAAGMQATLALADIDFIEELRLRRWARENYVPTDEREGSWHPVVLDEMRSKDEDDQESD